MVVMETLWPQSLKCVLYSPKKEKKIADLCLRKKTEKEFERLTTNFKTKFKTQKTS